MTPLTLYFIGAFLVATGFAFYVNHSWYKDCNKIIDDWSEFCHEIVDEMGKAWKNDVRKFLDEKRQIRACFHKFEQGLISEDGFKSEMQQLLYPGNKKEDEDDGSAQ